MMANIVEAIMEGAQNGNFSLNFTSGGLGLLVYILQAWALYTIAERRGIKKPWLAWVPVVNVWILGSISDQYQYVVKRQVKNKRKVLLGLEIAMAALAIILIIALVWLVVSLIMVGISTELLIDGNMIYTDWDTINWQILADEIGVLILLCLLGLPLAVLSVVQTVYFYIAMYDVFCSCEPKNSTMYLVLSLVGNVVLSGAYCIFLLLCKDKDLGMPPRKPEIVEEISQNTEE